MSKQKRSMHDLVFEGIKLSYNRLLEQQQKNDGELVFSKDGKIIKIKARDLTKIKVHLP